MTVELRPEVTASTQDLYMGVSANFVRNAYRAETFLRVADNIEEVFEKVGEKGLSLQDDWGSKLIWSVHMPGENNEEETQLSFFVDQVDRHIWIEDTNVDRFRELFGKTE